jgi:predicted transcriptional regulator of viral defense system
MTTLDVNTKIRFPIFSRNDIVKLFPQEPTGQINTQLHRMLVRGDLVGLKRGLYVFSGGNVDEFVLANKLYTPSYVSLESVLNTSGVIPDYASSVTSVTPITSKKFNTLLGSFSYSKLSKNLYFGYSRVLDSQSGIYYDIATPEKALLDFIYIRKIRELPETRFDMSNIDREVLFSYSIHFPKWVREVIKNA